MGTLLGVPHNKDYSILGSILGSPYFGKLPFVLNIAFKLIIPTKIMFGLEATREMHVNADAACFFLFESGTEA